MSIIDNVDMLRNGYVDINNSQISLSFGQPGQRPYVGEWSIMSAEKTRNLNNQRTAMYKLIGYSPHMTKFPKVQRSFQYQPATSIAQNLIQQYLGPNKPISVKAPSGGILGNMHMPYNLNGIQIHKAIRSTLLQATSTKDTSSAYLFFENQHEMVIDTMQNMISNMSGGPKFYQRPLGKDFFQDVAIQPFVILSMREESRANRPSQIQGENQATNVIDQFTNQYTKGKGGASTYNNMMTDALKPLTMLPQVMEARRKMAGAMDSQALTIHIALNTDVTVGRGFHVEVQSPAGDTDDTVKLASISGDLLATEVRHTVNLDQSQKMSGTTTVKGVKGDMES